MFNFGTRHRGGAWLRAAATLLGALAGATALAAPIIDAINTDKARYQPGSATTIYVDLKNQTGATFNGSVSLYFRHLGTTAGADQSISVANLAANGTQGIAFNWTPPSTDFRGYLVEVWVRKADGTIVENSSIAIDVSSDWARFPRYGYLSEFGTGFDAYNRVWQLKNKHVNALQFYDWQWQHHRPYNSSTTWKEIANRDVSRTTIQTMIAAAHDYNMMAMNYNLMYGAYAGYDTDGTGVQQSWGLYKTATPTGMADQDRHPLPAGWASPYLYVFNPSSTGWQNYLFGKEAEVFSNFAFDGWHIDSLGNRGTVYTWNGQSVNMVNSYAGFINNARASLGKRMVFNTVATDGQDQVAQSANVDVIYSELWDDAGTDDYADINAVADRARARTSKGIVFAAYMNRDYCGGNPGNVFRTPSVLLANATIFASGATHLELGDGNAMLCTEYFPNKNLTMSGELSQGITDYYNFLVAYENLLLDGAKTSTARVDLSNVPSSTNGSAGAVWKLRKTRTGQDIVHFINLKNNASTKWRDKNADYPYPDVLNNLPAKLYYSGTLTSGKKLWFASPDFDHGKAYEIAYSMGTDSGGKYVSFTLPYLKYWTAAWLER